MRCAGKRILHNGLKSHLVVLACPMTGRVSMGEIRCQALICLPIQIDRRFCEGIAAVSLTDFRRVVMLCCLARKLAMSGEGSPFHGGLCRRNSPDANREMVVRSVNHARADF